MKTARIISDFERGAIDYKTMARMIKRAALKRGRTDSPRKGVNWK